MLDLSLRLGPLALDHPVINASGTMELLELEGVCGGTLLTEPPVAAYVPKTVTLSPRPGNPPPRVTETVGGMINAVGLPSPGLKAFVADELPRLLDLQCPLILSIGGFSTEEYAALAGGLREAVAQRVGDDWTSRVGLELNISCPNVHSGCASIGSDAAETEDVVATVRESWAGLLIVKLTPNVTNIAEIGRAAERAGADAVSAVNTFKGLVVDRESLRPRLGNVTGGLSGPAIKPLALRAVYELFEALDIPIVGMGGIATVQDVLDFLACGARVVAVGSSGFQEPVRARLLANELAHELSSRGLDLAEVVGLAHV